MTQQVERFHEVTIRQSGLNTQELLLDGQRVLGVQDVLVDMKTKDVVRVQIVLITDRLNGERDIT